MADQRGRSQRSSQADSIARGLKRGESGATAVVQRRVRRIISFRGYGIPLQDRADLVQEVMAQLWQSVGRKGFDADAGFWGFVETVAVRRCIDWWRTQRQTVELDPGLQDARRGPLAQVLERERSQEVVAALSEVPKPCQDLILMRFSLGKSYRQIAELTGKSEGALRVQLHRCLGTFRELLQHRRESGAVSPMGLED